MSTKNLSMHHLLKAQYILSFQEVMHYCRRKTYGNTDTPMFGLIISDSIIYEVLHTYTNKTVSAIVDKHKNYLP